MFHKEVRILLSGEAGCMVYVLLSGLGEGFDVVKVFKVVTFITAAARR